MLRRPVPHGSAEAGEQGGGDGRQPGGAAGDLASTAKKARSRMEQQFRTPPREVLSLGSCRDLPGSSSPRRGWAKAVEKGSDWRRRPSPWMNDSWHHDEDLQDVDGIDI